jgi:hypothetical protein
MDVFSTYRVFLVKTLKEKKYFWARNVFFLLFPLFFILAYLFSGSSSSGNSFEANSHASPTPRTYLHINEVRIVDYLCCNSRSTDFRLYRRSCLATFQRELMIEFTSCQMTLFIWILWSDFDAEFQCKMNE